MIGAGNVRKIIGLCMCMALAVLTGVILSSNVSQAAGKGKGKGKAITPSAAQYAALVGGSKAGF